MDLSATVIRPEDHLVLELEFRGVNFTPPSGAAPGEVRGASGARLIAHFQPQHIAEQAFYQSSEDLAQPGEPGIETPLAPGAVQSRMAGSSRLAFDVPASEKFPYTLEGVLEAIQRLPLSVDAVSAYDPDRTGCLPLDLLLKLFNVPPAPHVAPPTDTQTAIEVPYRLILSPDNFSSWSHSSAPITHAGWTELWHTRLGSHRSADADPRVRAIWSPDFDPDHVLAAFDTSNPTAVDPFRSSLDARDRNDLVHLTADHYIPDFIPSPVATERFELSTLGATLEVQGDWDPPTLRRGQKISLTQWRHEAFIGRDEFVRVVRLGYLVPFGHRATLVKVTERKFYHDGSGANPGFVAYLFQRYFLVVKEFERSYGHRAMPFRTIRIRTRQTPNLAPPDHHRLIPGTPGSQAFWPHVVRPPDPNDRPFLFDVVATYWGERSVAFSTPLAFVDATTNVGEPAAVVEGYNGGPHGLRTPDLRGQPVAFAPSKEAGDTSFDTASVTFEAESRTGEGPTFRPSIAEAEVVVPAVQQVTGRAGTSTIEWEPTYLAGAGDAIGNAADLFATVKSGELNFGSTERSGGLVAPNLSISGLSRSLGPIGGPASDMVFGKFDPQKVFGKEIKLLGGIALSDILDLVGLDEAAKAAGHVPKLLTKNLPDRIETAYTWDVPADKLRKTDLFEPKGSSSFHLEARVTKSLDPANALAEPTFVVTGGIRDFAVVLLPSSKLVRLDVTSVTFDAQRGKKVDVAVTLGKIEFLGILGFVNHLQEFIPLDGFEDPPSLKVVTSPHPGVDVGFTLGIPTIGIGIMTMQNVSLGASVFLPFGDDPLNFHFAFCQREQPFILTVSLFGGGGFFAMDVGIDKVVMVEAALEFGAAVALNLVVAQGQVSIMAGFYFQKTGEGFSLSGYLRASGSLSVIGVINVSLVFYLGLTYASKDVPPPPHAGTLWGQATLTVKIEILFFSTSVGVSLEREFAGTDPTFRDLISPSAWSSYCHAYASYS
jgi:hypothetical protein